MKHSELKKILDYDNSTGIFIWKERRGRGAKKGWIAEVAYGYHKNHGRDK